jgi:SAM-dependent methyltransferase
MAQAFSWQGEQDDETVRRQITWLDGLAGHQAVRELRSWALDVSAVKPGERAVDVGCGTGEQVREFASAGAEAFGVEPSGPLRAEASRRANDSLAGFVDGTAEALPFATGSVDVIGCERVLQHLDRPAAAAAEFARVLRPGGRAVVIDMDWGTTVLHPGDLRAAEEVAKAQEETLPNPRAGRCLTGLLAGAGLEVTGIVARALVIWKPATGGWGLVGHLAAQACRQGRITDQEHERLMADLAAGAERGDFHFSVTMFAASARA